MLRKIVSFIIVFPLLIVPLFCSCVQKVEAGTVGVEHCSHDEDSHSAKHDESQSEHGHSCNCDHALNVAIENLTTSQANFSFVPNFSPVSIFIEPVSVVLLKGSMHLAYLGPPGKSSAVPFYIQYHSLRI